MALTTVLVGWLMFAVMYSDTLLKFVGNMTLVRPFLPGYIAQLPDTTFKINSTLCKHVIVVSKKDNFTWILARSRNMESDISKYANVNKSPQSEVINFRGGKDANCSEWLSKQLELVPVKAPRTALSSPWRSGNTWLRHLNGEAVSLNCFNIGRTSIIIGFMSSMVQCFPFCIHAYDMMWLENSNGF
ncbi:hypothetical protein MAR_029281 [Mya arenaria]|uniref:Uncharacterized protein n=1 Tax=Mya arenaria TaxID=6604 RepID=A0ABY7DJ07_MYAAR|nr:hypothetical protein MAR_029281 [Mya arenaria]